MCWHFLFSLFKETLLPFWFKRCLCVRKCSSSMSRFSWRKRDLFGFLMCWYSFLHLVHETLFLLWFKGCLVGINWSYSWRSRRGIFGFLVC
ncbi:hypothetical protein OIU74_009878 [Salix koriyanagi]|uniref:Uncharacterized protein n=1 Tax=Salix koriyanagi TaxID=2511006 RepID=A0A9Q0QL09_9ROSI|nr:hypothetical protein OIU74_009878 [Salix koriyanagi]